MRTLRSTNATARLAGGFVAVLLTYGLLWQGLLTAYGEAAMAGQGPDRLAFVICAPLGQTATPDDTEGHPGHDCCKGLCQNACRGDTAQPAGSPGLVVSFMSGPTVEPDQFRWRGSRIDPHRLAEARAPPPLV
ncbi:MAG: hypothetical protein GY798_01210 [Hyphomicrobiales bacterium]|nr:hypothetical protein [Hyphomicrobiales bacterium]